MSVEYVEREQTVEVPKETGVDGFLFALKQILKLSRVAHVNIDSRGVIKVKRWVRQDEDEDTRLAIDFDGLHPYNIIRNGEVEDLGYADQNDPLKYLADMFRVASSDHMSCVAFVSGADTIFYKWCDRLAKVRFKDEVFGLPLLRDRFIEDDVLLLCTAYGKGAGMQDVRKSYKITIPREGGKNGQAG